MRYTSFLALLATLSLGACAVPFSEMQSARLTGPGRVEITPSYSYVKASSSEEGESGGKLQDEFGLQVATGLTSRIDLRARYERVQVPGEGEYDGVGANVFGIGPKVSLIKDRLALNLPVGFGWGGGLESSETYQVHPTIIGTVPVSPMFEVNGSFKGLIPISGEDRDNLLAANLGLGIGMLEQWAMRPEVGVLWNPGEEGRLWQFSVGFSRSFGR